MYLLSLKTTHAVHLSKWDCQVRVGQDNIRSVILTWSRGKTIFNFFLKEEPYLLDSVATTYFRFGLGKISFHHIPDHGVFLRSFFV